MTDLVAEIDAILEGTEADSGIPCIDPKCNGIMHLQRMPIPGDNPLGRVGYESVVMCDSCSRCILGRVEWEAFGMENEKPTLSAKELRMLKLSIGKLHADLGNLSQWKFAQVDYLTGGNLRQLLEHLDVAKDMLYRHVFAEDNHNVLAGLDWGPAKGVCSSCGKPAYVRCQGGFGWCSEYVCLDCVYCEECSG